MSDKPEKQPKPAESGSPLVLMNKMIEKGIEPDALKKMMDMASEWQRQQALIAFNIAMNECQKEMPRVMKNATNTQTKKKYADLIAICDAIKPVYTEQGFSVSFSEDTCPTPGVARIRATLQHIGGHSASYWADVPIDDGKGPKGGQMAMTVTQGKGSTLAYGRRYLLHLIFNLTIADEDNDGNATVGTLDQDQIKVINDLIEDCATEGRPIDYPKFKEWLLGEGVEGSLENVPSTEFARAVDFLNRRIRKQRADKAAKGDAK